MRRAILPLVLVLLLAAVMPRASAWVIEEGVIISDATTTVYVRHDIEVLTDAYWDGTAFYVAPFGFDFEPSSGTWEWNLTNWSAPLAVTFQGSPTQPGTAQFLGFPGIYQVTGLQGYGTFLISGPTFTLNVLPGNQTFTITPASTLTSGLNLLVSSRWNPAQDTVASAATVLDATGNPITGASVNHTLLRPDGSLFSGVTMTATSVAGVYVANVTVPDGEPDGAWVVTVSYGGTVASESVVKGGVELQGMIETVADPYFAYIVWVGMLLFALWLKAWFPVAAHFLAFANEVLPTEVWPLEASVMLVVIAWVTHAVRRSALQQRMAGEKGDL